MSGSASNLPIRIEVDGVPQAEAAFNRVATSGQRAMTRVEQGSQQAATGTRNLGAAIGQAGFQVQDFATQVSMGQNALTAFSTQASQFLGVFGTGGAIAGAVLTVGVLAAQLLKVGENGEEAKEGIDNFTKSLDGAAREAERVIALLARVEGRFLSITERARVAQLREVTADISALNNEARDTQLRLLDRENTAGLARRRADGLTAQIADLQNPSASFGGAGVSPAEIAAIARQRDEALREAESAEADVRNLRAQIQRFDALIGRSEGLLQGIVADGTNPNPGTPDREPATGRTGGGGGRGGQSAEDRFLAAEALARRTAQAALSNTRELSTEFERAAKQIDQTEDVTRQLGLTFNSAFEDMISKGRGFSDVLKAIEQDLARLIIRQSVTTPLANAANSLLGNLVGGATDFVGSFFPRSEIVGPVGAPKFGGARADGGPVSAGSLYMVGERGPEWFVPNQSGTILPNGASPAMNITHAPVFNISSDVSPAMEARMVAIAQASNADLLARINRGGQAARTVGRR